MLGIEARLDAQRGYLFHWVPVCLAVGIGGYFGLRQEPDLAQYGMALGCICAMLGLGRVLPVRLGPFLWILILVLAGGLLAGLRANMVAAPVLEYRYYGAVQGRIVKVDRSASDAVRLTLDRVVLQDMPPQDMPRKVRVSLHGAQVFLDPQPGLTVILTAHLSPPARPVEPGGFDFQRHAWFEGLGAVGYTRSPALTLYPVKTHSLALFVNRLRARISRAVQAQLPGEAGAFAAAIMTGDRSGIGQETLENLRGSNLSHLLAISGLHMGLLTGFVFAALRYGLALIPYVALRVPTKKIAAVVALCVGLAYLALSGGNVATERAFVMVSVMFLAILLDRRAITLRAVALAAVIILLFRPEVLTQPGFQMSFAATTALVAVFSAMRNLPREAVPRYLRPVLAVILSSAVAGAATAPVAAAHFNRIADYGLIANLLSVPLMGAVVMPAAVLAACLAPLGLGGIGLSLMAPPIRWILGVADWVSHMDGAVTHVIAPPASVLPVFAIGALWIILWRGKWWERGLGLFPIVLAAFVWGTSQRPDLLISDTGGLVGIMTDDGRVLSKSKGEGFAAQNWLENDGDGVEQVQAFARAGFSGGKGAMFTTFDETRIVHLTGRGATEKVGQSCETAALVILSGEVDSTDQGCWVLDRAKLAQSGAMAITFGQDKLTVQNVAETTGDRLWNTPEIRRNRVRFFSNLPFWVR
ncbi:MAG: ComEC/Rec2 family competence protein [Marinosulfonomonas sp.]